MNASVAPTTESKRFCVANGRPTTALLAFLSIIILSIFFKVDVYADVVVDVDNPLNNVNVDDINNGVYNVTYSGVHFDTKDVFDASWASWNILIGGYTPKYANKPYALLHSDNRFYMYYVDGSTVKKASLFTGWFKRVSDGGGNKFQSGSMMDSDVSGVNTYVLTSTSLPIFTDQAKMENFLLSGVLNVDDITNAPSVSTGSLGVIKPKYSANGSDTTASTFREYIEWQPTSTSGFDVTGAGVGVQFAIKDRSYYHNHRLGQPSNYYDFVYSRVAWLTSKIYPSGSSKRAWLEGSATNSSLYGQMRIIGEARGSDLQYGFSAWSLYANQNTDGKLSTFANALLNNNQNTIMDTVMATSDANASVCLSYDIYARIHDGGGQRYGNWLKINKNSTPVDQQSDRINGGITKEPVVIPNFPSTPSSTDWFVTDDDEPSSDEDDKDNDPLPVGINDPNDGSPTYIYNNYTYNYDNRTWIENYYTNEDTDNVGDGINLLKGLPDLLSLFEKFFGGLVPAWAIAFVLICIPIAIALIVFKVFKSIIPFV